MKIILFQFISIQLQQMLACTLRSIWANRNEQPTARHKRIHSYCCSQRCYLSTREENRTVKSNLYSRFFQLGLWVSPPKNIKSKVTAVQKMHPQAVTLLHIKLQRYDRWCCCTRSAV
uniref:Putative secreted protein n=1 Tax=Amblyomma parvum TaxID=251391 RepID=A0A023G2M3_AMBPA